MKSLIDNNFIGIMGEHYFAYWVARNFNWPCRLLDVDIGIDAQIEIFENNFSTGDFIPVQIKSKNNKELYKDIDAVDFNYWNQIGYGVLLILILINDNDEPEMYWEYFDLDRTASILEEQKVARKPPLNWQKRVHFSKRLVPESKKELIDIFNDPAFIETEGLAERLIKHLEHYNELYNLNKRAKGSDVIIGWQPAVAVKYLFRVNDIYNDIDTLTTSYKHNKEVQRKGVYTSDAFLMFDELEVHFKRDFLKIVTLFRKEFQPEQFLPPNLNNNLFCLIAKTYPVKN
ncbi:TPA: DUF4365 domain-containing protein [Enterobacter cloacae]